MDYIGYRTGVRELPPNSRIVTSDDVFDYMLNIRCLNEGIDQRRSELFSEYLDIKYSDFQMKSMADYEALKRKNQARRNTQSRFFGCQFIISTHSPFVLAIDRAKIYDLDEDPVDVKPWTQLENVRAYYEFFLKHRDEF